MSRGAPDDESQPGEVVAPDDVASKDDVNGAKTFGILGMVLGLLGFAAAAVGRRRRPPAS